MELKPPEGTAVKVYFRLHGYEKPGRHGLHADHPLLSGVYLGVPRWEAEPERGVYDWSLIEEAMSPFVEAGKEVILRVIPYSKGMTTPRWVLEEGIPLINFSSKGKGAVFPVPWDERTLRLYEDFIRALAGRFDGDPNITLIEMGVGSLGFLLPEYSREGVAAFREAGWTPEIWEGYIYRVMDLYLKCFNKTRLSIIFSGALIRGVSWLERLDMGRRIGRYAAGHGVSIDFNSLDSDKVRWKETGLPEIIATLSDIAFPRGFAILFGDDWPLWVSEASGRRNAGPGTTGGRDDAALRRALGYAFDEWDRVGRRCPLYFTLLEPEVSATNPHRPESYEENVARILLDALNEGLNNNCRP